MKKTIKLAIFVIIVVMSVLAMSSCGPSLTVGSQYPQSSSYTEGEHYERVYKLIEKNYINAYPQYYTSFTLRPLYDEEDGLTAFCVDFKPSGLTFIKVWEYDYSSKGGRGMYSWCADGSPDSAFEFKWARFYEIKVDDRMEPRQEPDENGQPKYYYENPYKELGASDQEKWYFLNPYHKKNGVSFYPAVKRGDEFENLLIIKGLGFAPEIARITTFSPYSYENLE